MAAPRLGRLCPGSSMLFLCDMQERFRHSVAFFPQIVTAAARVLQGCRELGVPAVVTEQRPEVLGPTVPELGAHDLPKHPKTCFSMVVPAVEAELRARPHLTSALLCGIETQACILHTALDLLERGLDVHVVVDACSSRRWTGWWRWGGCGRAGPSSPRPRASSSSCCATPPTPASARCCSW
ncbi:isochorismatase domain-containing protein 2 isoform X2 [Accipiter gentilis]|uniref:isochorismatase domain-containing protein 2 isoform X2 n=1 Tax=Astur gentilis TaxID=8957 RepID=UPI00211059E4|nr:isochorismatase domain-containing protein 2 isoform X2 [Accipiter gentilis]